MSVLRAITSRRIANGVSAQATLLRPAILSPPRTFTTTTANRTTEKDPQLGDYPDVPERSYQLRKYDKHWWDPQEKRNFGEIPAEQDDILSVWAPDVNPNVDPYVALKQLGIAVSIFAVFVGIVYVTTPEMPAERRTYPRGGLAEELGNPQAAAYKDGDFDAKDDDDDDDDE